MIFLDHSKKIKLILIIFLAINAVSLSKNFAILVGINDYAYFNDLEYAEKDAKDLNQLLLSLGFETTLFIGKLISPDTVLGEISRISKYSKEKDTLIFFFSGHGASGEDEGKKGLLTYYSKQENNTMLISHERLKKAFDDFKGNKNLCSGCVLSGESKEKYEKR